MFDAGFWELLVIGVLALVVVGPERLPRLARVVGLWVGRARHAFYSVRDEIEREANLDGLRETEHAVRRSVQETENEVRSSLSTEQKDGVAAETDNTSQADESSAATSQRPAETDTKHDQG